MSSVVPGVAAQEPESAIIEAPATALRLVVDRNSDQPMTALTECVPEYLGPAGSVLPPAEIINAAVTSVAVCLDEAGAAFTAQQIDQVCSHLEQASALLDAAIMALTAQAAHEAQHVKLAPAESPVVERPRAMAMSA